MFYLANDVIQNCKRKNAKVFQDTFKKCLVEAVSLVRNDDIKKNIERMFDVWMDRSVYDKEFISKLNQALYAVSGVAKSGLMSPVSHEKAADSRSLPATADEEKQKHDLEQIIAEFQPKKLCEAISAFQTIQNEAGIFKTNVEATRLLDINFEHIKQYRG